MTTWKNCEKCKRIFDKVCDCEKVNQKIEVDLSEEDLQRLMDGETFDWSFPDQNGVSVDIKLFQGEEND